MQIRSLQGCRKMFCGERAPQTIHVGGRARSRNFIRGVQQQFGGGGGGQPHNRGNLYWEAASTRTHWSVCMVVRLQAVNCIASSTELVSGTQIFFYTRGRKTRVWAIGFTAFVPLEC